jgi:5-keto-L-gluconate epimerase
MKYGILISVSKTKFGPVVFKEDVIKNIIRAKSIGFDGVELAIKNTKDVNIGEIREVIEKNNLTVLSLGTGQIYFDEGLSFGSNDKGIRINAVQKVKEVIEVAHHFNSSIIIGLIRGNVENGGADNFKDKLEEVEERICDCMVECMDYSEKYGTNFLLEPINRYETNIFNRVEDTGNFLNKNKNRLDLNRIGILADTFHMNIEEPVINESISKYSNLIKQFHFADSNRWAPGYGHIDFINIIKTLKENKYDGFISFEMLPLPNPIVSAKRALNFIKNLVKKEDFK